MEYVLAKDTKCLLVLCTCDGLDVAEQISQGLVEHKLAACVNIVSNVASFFRWQGKLESNSELLLMIKTTGACFVAVEQKIKSLHPFAVPEIIAIPIVDGSQDYLDWIGENVG